MINGIYIGIFLYYMIILLPNLIILLFFILSFTELVVYLHSFNH